MKFFSKLTFICNLGFLVFVILAFVEINNKRNNRNDNIIPLPFIEGTLVILGQFAIFINLVFCLTALVLMAIKKFRQFPSWVVIVNFIFLLLQFYYFFIYRN